ncbi:putative ABC transport system permease protein [Diaminobutyricimonas aerilata]|uniref:Putative ABC transport system permease protein n=1 Tax=Diaminobutyricimonas aerilata TaxID=1162967 RepID=A0A2M9CGD0_9MICO|nr:FtsX-like permease family protein [Diaminobutyricimonas aerilata]PJJ70920.1 putative ABC transport system permease protein [Diaminobutyricimonas aerilata]
MTALGRRVRRMIAERKGRFVGTVILVLVGSFYFTAATGIAGSLERMVVGFAEENRQEDLTFTTDRPLRDIPAREADLAAVIDEQSQHEVALPGAELRLLEAGTEVNTSRIMSGRDLENPGEVLLDPRFFAAQNRQLGDEITLDGRSFTVVGTVAVPNYVYILKNYHDVLPTTGFGIGVISAPDMTALRDAEGAPDPSATYSVRFTEREGLDERIDRFREQISRDGYAITEWRAADDNPRISMPWGNITSMQSMSLPVSIAFFLLSSVVVSVIVMRAVKSDSIVIGTLYALGYRRRELIRHYLIIPVLIAGLGGIAGVLLALPAVGPFVSTMLATYNLPDTVVFFTPLNLAVAVLVPVVLIGMVSLLAMRRVLRTRAADLMRGTERSARVNVLERALRLDRLPFARTFRIREQLRSIPRLVFLLLGVAAASTVMLFGLTFSNSMNTVTEKGALARYEYPLEYNFTALRNLHEDPLPEGAEPYHATRVHPEGRESATFYLTGLLPDSVGMRLKDSRGDELRRDQVNVTSPLADRLGISQGDTVRVVNELTGAAYSFRIDGIVHAYGEQFITMPLDDFNRLTGYPEGSYRTVLASHEMEFDEAELSGVLDTRDPDAFDDIGAPTGLVVGSVTAVAALIAVIILSLVTSLIIDENRSTISLLKILGYRRKEVAKLILGSTTPAVIAGFALGVPLMLVFADTLFDLVAETANMVLPVMMSPLDILISFVVIMVVYRITRWISGRRLAKVSMSEALKAE